MAHPLSNAIKEGRSADEIGALIQSNPMLLRHKNDLGWLPLHAAAYYKAPVEVVELIMQGWDQALLEKVDKVGWTPVHVAARYASAEVVEALVKACPEALRIQEVNGWTPVHLAAEHASAEVVEMLAKACPEALLLQDSKGWTPVHQAAAHSELAVVQCLAKACPGALLITTKDGELPADVVRKGKTDVATWLEKFMKEVPLSSSPGETPSQGVHQAAPAPGSPSRAGF
jgi:ankyrin repeat protein